MHVRFCIALLPLLAFGAGAHTQTASPPAVYRIHKLTLASGDLHRNQRQDIIRAFQGGTYNLEALAERIRFKFRDAGYEFAKVDKPQISHVHPAQSACEADVTIHVHAGAQYRLAGITFTVDPGQSVFTAAQLRRQFPLDDGAIFSAGKIGKGLDNLKALYGSAGYANFGAIPKPVYDNARHTIGLAIDLDQGRPVTFGGLLMEGIEPRAGVAKELTASWTELEGRLYNPKLLKDWLKKNSADWPPETASQAHIEYLGQDPSAFNVLLHFQ